MAVLVTGGAGYIGSHVVWNLHDRGEEVVVIDNLSTGFSDSLPKEVKVVVADVQDRQSLLELIQSADATEIIHMAGSLLVAESVIDPLMYYYNNTEASRLLIEEAVHSGIERFIFSSSAAVYGSPVEIPVTEESVLCPTSPYGWSKRMTEVMLEHALQAYPKFNYVSLRYFNVAGADPRGRCGESTESATHLIKAAVQAALGLRSHLALYGTDYQTRDGTCVRDYIHVTDLAEAHVNALERLREGERGMTLNCGYGRGFSVREIIESVKRVSGSDFKVIEQARRPGDPAAIVADPALAQEMLNWSPKWDEIDTIVEHALAWETKLRSAR